MQGTDELQEAEGALDLPVSFITLRETSFSSVIPLSLLKYRPSTIDLVNTS